MRYIIRHESASTLRVHMAAPRMTMAQADILEYYLKELPQIKNVKVYDRTGDAVISYLRKHDARKSILEALDSFSYRDEKAVALVPEETGRALDHAYAEKLLFTAVGKAFRSIFFPVTLNAAWTAVKSVKFVCRGLACLMRGKIEVPVLDAAAISASIALGDFDTAGSVMFLLDIGETLEEWTYKKSVGNLARAMSLKVDRVWMKNEGEDVLMDVREIREGDRIVVRTSNIIPLDGEVIEGEAAVNQASMTGESIPAEKHPGSYVYAGTVVEEGELTARVTRVSGTGKYDQIVRMIEDSEKLKSSTEARAFHLADRLVPYSLLGTAVTWLITGNVARAISFLMVDFSCALKLSMPLSVLSAMGEAGRAEISVKGGKFLEAAAQADTIVFDKTGTLTYATPTLVQIVSFNGSSEAEILRVAACLEEHYPHSMANAVVEAAKARGIEHDEMHQKVEYIVAHGIASMIDGKRVLIGSYHFVFEDEHCSMSDEAAEAIEKIPAEYSRLYMTTDGRLAAVLCIFDPLRKEAAGVIDELHALGVTKVCMMTGDSSRTAEAVARALCIDEYHAEVLPEDKAEFIRQEHAAGRKVLMIGDGVNDTPALSEADAGIAVRGGAAIAREVADITIPADSLERLVTLRKLSIALMDRINSNYRFIISFNAALIALGVAGILPPASSALLHNTSTIVSGLKSMTALLPSETVSERK